MKKKEIYQNIFKFMDKRYFVVYSMHIQILKVKLVFIYKRNYQQEKKYPLIFGFLSNSLNVRQKFVLHLLLWEKVMVLCLKYQKQALSTMLQSDPGISPIFHSFQNSSKYLSSSNQEKSNCGRKDLQQLFLQLQKVPLIWLLDKEHSTKRKSKRKKKKQIDGSFKSVLFVCSQYPIQLFIFESSQKKLIELRNTNMKKIVFQEESRIVFDPQILMNDRKKTNLRNFPNKQKKTFLHQNPMEKFLASIRLKHRGKSSQFMNHKQRTQNQAPIFSYPLSKSNLLNTENITQKRKMLSYSYEGGKRSQVMERKNENQFTLPKYRNRSLRNNYQKAKNKNNYNTLQIVSPKKQMKSFTIQKRRSISCSQYSGFLHQRKQKKITKKKNFEEMCLDWFNAETIERQDKGEKETQRKVMF